MYQEKKIHKLLNTVSTLAL